MRNEFDDLRKSYFKKDQELEEINFQLIQALQD